jgi:MYXO-CTERM domain-containing protein
MTSTPSGSSTRPCGTTVLGAGMVLLAVVFGKQRRRGGI